MSPGAVTALKGRRDLTKSVIDLFQGVVQHATERRTEVPFEIYTEVLECVASLIGESSTPTTSLFTVEDLLQFLQLADHLSSLCKARRTPSFDGCVSECCVLQCPHRPGIDQAVLGKRRCKEQRYS